MTKSVDARSMHDQRSKWWWMLTAIPLIAGVLTARLAPQPHGHWSEHLSGAALKTAQLVVLLLLASMLGRTLRAGLLISFALVLGGIVMQVLGDYQVAESIWRTTGNPEFGVGYSDGHDRSELGDMLVLAGGLAFALVAGVSRWVPLWLAVVAAMMVVIPPPFFWPAAGVLVLMLYNLISTSRSERVMPEPSLSRGIAPL